MTSPRRLHGLQGLLLRDRLVNGRECCVRRGRRPCCPIRPHPTTNKRAGQVCFTKIIPIVFSEVLYAAAGFCKDGCLLENLCEPFPLSSNYDRRAFILS